MSLHSKTFWVAAAERAIKTFAQTLAGVLTLNNVGILDAPWVAALSTSVMTSFLSLLTSIASAAATDGNPSIGSSEVLADPQKADPVSGPPVEVTTDEFFEGWDGNARETKIRQ